MVEIQPLITRVEDLPELEGDDQVAAVFPTPSYLLDMVIPLAVEPLSPTEKARARGLLSRFLGLAEQNRAHVFYSQTRPFDPTVDPRTGFTGDCSSYATQAFEWVRSQVDFPLHDPSGPIEHDGYGYTGTLLATNHQHSVPLNHRFFVGDIGLYGPYWATRHAVVCRKGGYAADAIWSSHGTPSGPDPVRLRYRKDLLGVYRPLSLL